jgi:hypothetical protein
MRIGTMKTILEFIDNSNKGDFIDKKLWQLKKDKIVQEIKSEIDRNKLNIKINNRKYFLLNKDLIVEKLK